MFLESLALIWALSHVYTQKKIESVQLSYQSN